MSFAITNRRKDGGKLSSSRITFLQYNAGIRSAQSIYVAVDNGFRVPVPASQEIKPFSVEITHNTSYPRSAQADVWITKDFGYFGRDPFDSNTFSFESFVSSDFVIDVKGYQFVGGYRFADGWRPWSHVRRNADGRFGFTSMFPGRLSRSVVTPAQHHHHQRISHFAPPIVNRTPNLDFPAN